MLKKRFNEEIQIEKVKCKFSVALVFFLFVFLFSTTVSADRLPTVGGDSDSWGIVLNTFLNVSHNESGELRNDTVSTSKIIDGTIIGEDISNTTNLTLGQKITFAFGEMIDNIVDGWIRITGGLNVTGNISTDSYFIGDGSYLSGIVSGLFSNVSGVATYDGDVNITGNLSLGEGKIMFNDSSKKYVYYNGTDWDNIDENANVPAGAIMAFNSATCPTGWVLADGTSGTPDLTDLDLTQKEKSGCRVRLGAGQPISSGIFTKLAFTIEWWDIQGEFDNVTNYRFTAKQAGYYQVNLQAYILDIVSGSWVHASIYKNGGEIARGSYSNLGAIASCGSVASDIIYLDVGDYIEGYVRHNSAGTPLAEATTWNNYMSIEYLGISPNTSMTYCMKTAEDTETSNTIWATSGDDVVLNNASKNLNIKNSSGSSIFSVDSSTGIVSMPHQSGCRVRLTSEQTIPTGTWTKLQFRTEDWDIQGEFDNVTNYRFTATKAGYYQVNLNGCVGILGDGDSLYTAIYRNGVIASGYGHILVGGAGHPASTSSDILYLDVGDYLEGVVNHNFGSDRTAPTEVHRNYMSIMKIA